MRFVLIMILAVLSGCATIPQENKCIRLTFDDGPNSLYTEKILDTLKSRNVKATFFVLGKNVTDHPSITKRIVAEGHSIGNHTWDHPHLTKLHLDSVRLQFQITSDIIEMTVGFRPTEWRPPYEDWNTAIEQEAKRQGMRMVLWRYEVDGEDWKATTANGLVQKILSNVRPGDIVLLHDTYQVTVIALPTIIDGIKAKGHCFQ